MGKAKFGFEDEFVTHSRHDGRPEILRQLFRGLIEYVPEFFDGRVTLFRAHTPPLYHSLSPDLGWSHYVQDLDVHGVPGDHNTILVGAGREPIWPSGVKGSITHCRGLCAAAVASSDEVRSIGLDAQENLPLPKGVLEVVLSSRDQGLQSEPRNSIVCSDRLLFCVNYTVGGIPRDTFQGRFVVNRNHLASLVVVDLDR